MLDDRLEDGRRPLLPLGAEGVVALHDTPAVVAALLDLVDHLPQVLADLAGPQVRTGTVEAELPRLPQAVRPDLPARPLRPDEGIILRGRVALALRRAVHVDP